MCGRCTGVDLSKILKGKPKYLGTRFGNSWRSHKLLSITGGTCLDCPLPKSTPVGGWINRKVIGRLVIDGNWCMNHGISCLQTIGGWSCLSLFIHSFIQDISIAPLHVRYYSEALPTLYDHLCRSFMLKHHRQLWVKDLPVVPMWGARAGFKPTTLWTKSDESTNEPPLHTRSGYPKAGF